MTLRTIIVSSIKRIISIIIPIKNNKIVFTCFKGNGYTDSPKYIAEEIIKRNKSYDLVWLVRDLELNLPKQIRKVKIDSVKALFEYASAKVWVSNIRSTRGITKKRKQFYLQTWHAALHLKKVEAEASDLSEDFIKQSITDGKMTDLMFADNQFMYNQFRDVFWYEGKIIRCGVPRLGVIIHTPDVVYKKVRGSFKIEDDALIVLYAPTFRNNGNIDIYKWDYKAVCKAVEKITKKKAYILLKLHPNIDVMSDAFIHDDCVKNATYYDDMQELLAVADYLITDFSSVAFDFTIMLKPVVLFAPDYEKYINNERGFAIALDKLPYDLAETETQLIDWFERFNIANYKEKAIQFLHSIDFHDDGRGAELLVDIIDEVMNARGNQHSRM